jgi:hypothetical protein
MAFEAFYHTLSLDDQSSKSFQLDGTFIGTDNVALDLISGTAQAVNNDFAVLDGTALTWSGYNLDATVQASPFIPLMAAGDLVRVIFDRS